MYINLHHDTDSASTLSSTSTDKQERILYDPSWYSVCDVVGHVHDNSASMPFVLHNTTARAPASLSSLNAPSLSTSAPLHAIESPTDAPSLDNSHPTQTITKGLYIPVIPPDPFTSRDVHASGITTTPHPTPETSTPAPLTSGSPLATISLQHNPDLLSPSDPRNLLYFARFLIIRFQLVRRCLLLRPSPDLISHPLSQNFIARY
ncbi:hypothetical protein EI94DRAFT_711342 [Lactarius quietus]|nr:hypothetical protein EI94DRAFT_711342 [Lactarius quietus]